MRQPFAPIRMGLLAACLVMAGALASHAQGKDWKLVIRVQGTVESKLQGSDAWTRIVTSRLLAKGDQARTGAESRGQVRLGDGSVVAMGPNTTVTMEQFDYTSDERNVKLSLQGGRLRAKVSRFFGSKSRFEVETPNAVLAARGTDFFVLYDEEGTGGYEEGGWRLAADPGGPVFNTLVSVNEGQVDAFIGGETLTLGPGDTLGVDAGGGFILNPPGFTPTDVPTYSAGDTALYESDLDLDTEQGTIGETRTTFESPNIRDATGGSPVQVNPTAEGTGQIQVDINLSNFSSGP